MKIFKQKNSMFLKIAKYGFVLIIASVLMVPLVPVNAEVCTAVGTPKDCTPAKCTSTDKPYKGCIPKAGVDASNQKKAGVDNTGVKINSGIENPLGNSVSDIPSFIVKIISFVLTIGVPIVTLAIIYSGFLFVTAQGNSEKLKSAKKTLLYTLVGAALLLGSLAIAEAIKGTIKEIKVTVAQIIS